MLEKDAEEIAKDIYIHHFDDDVNYPDVLKAITVGVQKGAEHATTRLKKKDFCKYKHKVSGKKVSVSSIGTTSDAFPCYEVYSCDKCDCFKM